MIDDPMFSQKRRLILHSLLVAPAALFGREALAGEAKEMSLTQVTLGTATRGGGFEVYARCWRTPTRACGWWCAPRAAARRI